MSFGFFRTNLNTKSSKDNLDMPPPQTYINPDSQTLNRISKGDAKPEIHFIGQILGGENFQTSDGLFCEMILDIGINWDLISPPRLYQTQTSYAEKGSLYVWNHPIDLHLVANDLNGWPKAIFKVWRLDDSNKIDIFSYGITNLPRKAGFTKLVCDTWSPSGSSYGKVNYDALNFYFGNKPRLQSIDVLSKDIDKRYLINSHSNGKIVLEIECLMKNFDVLDITGQD